MDLQRIITQNIIERMLRDNKITVIYGARQTGKTTLANEIIKQLQLKSFQINADEQKFNSILSSTDFSQIKELIGDAKLLFIDEAQRIDKIGLNLKIIHDALPELKIIVTGSSSFELSNKVSEPLTGRKWTYTLYPITVDELYPSKNIFEIKQMIGSLLVFGSYPEIFKIENKVDKIAYLKDLSTDYLYKDSLELIDIKNANKVRELLKLLAYQIGSNVSFSELSNRLSIAKETVERYLDLLEKNFVIYRLSGLSRNLRKEVTQTPKYYFTDLGIRNALIDDFKTIDDRNDLGALWENFLITERIKKNAYIFKPYTPYFWRTYTGAEIDYVEDSDGILSGYEFKYKKNNTKAPKTWLSEYENATWKLINKDNFMEFISTHG